MAHFVQSDQISGDQSAFLAQNIQIWVARVPFSPDMGGQDAYSAKNDQVRGEISAHFVQNEQI